MPSLPRILLVDDDPAVRASLAFSLELEGFLIETFECGEELLERAQLPSRACFVFDYRLPGIDGLELLRTMRSRGSHLPAVVITTSPSRSLRAQAAQAGAVVVEKPLMGDALTAAVRAGLAQEAKAA